MHLKRIHLLDVHHYHQRPQYAISGNCSILHIIICKFLSSAHNMWTHQIDTESCPGVHFDTLTKPCKRDFKDIWLIFLASPSSSKNSVACLLAASPIHSFRSLHGKKKQRVLSFNPAFHKTVVVHEPFLTPFHLFRKAS